MRPAAASAWPISPNERLQQLYHPWSSYVIVPLFALANAGVVINTGLLSRAYTSPVTLGILIGYVVGKPVGTTGAAWLVTKLSRGRIRPPVGWAGVVGAGTIAGIGFTVALLIASLAFHGPLLAEAKLGILSAAFCASAITWTVFRGTRLLPKRLKIRALLGTSTLITDLAVPSTRTVITFAGRRRRRSPWWSTATSSARTAAWPSRSSGNCWPTSATSGTCSGTCR